MKKIKYSTNADYSAKSFYPFYSVEKIYNTILIPENLINEFLDIFSGDQIVLIKNNNKLVFNIGYEVKTITIKSQNYLLFYIARGLVFSNPLDIFQDIFIEHNNKKYKIDFTLDLTNPSVKLFMGLFVMSNVYSFAFNIDDRLLLNINDSVFIDNFYCANVSQSFNVFTALRQNTMIFLHIDKSIDSLVSLHSSLDNDTLSLRSLTTKRIKEKGCINLVCAGNNTAKITSDGGIDRFVDFIDYATVKDLDSGSYTISILDDHNLPVELSDNGILCNQIVVNIVDSVEIERNIILNDLISKNRIDARSIGQPEFLPRFTRNTDDATI